MSKDRRKSSGGRKSSPPGERRRKSSSPGRRSSSGRKSSAGGRKSSAGRKPSGRKSSPGPKPGEDAANKPAEREREAAATGREAERGRDSERGRDEANRAPEQDREREAGREPAADPGREASRGREADRGREAAGRGREAGGAAGAPPSSKGASKGTPKAGVVKFKAALRKEKRRRAEDPEVDYLNITAMLDLMTIILVFLLQTMASSTASVQEGGDLKLSRSVMSAEPAEEGVILIVSKTAILLGEEGEPILTLPSRAQLAQQGLDAKHKRSGPNDLYIVPLANRLRNARDLDKRLRAAKGLDPSTSEAIIIADATTPYRLLIEVLFTLGQSEFGKYHLMVMRKDAG